MQYEPSYIEKIALKSIWLKPASTQIIIEVYQDSLTLKHHHLVGIPILIPTRRFFDTNIDVVHSYPCNPPT